MTENISSFAAKLLKRFSQRVFQFTKTTHQVLNSSRRSANRQLTFVGGAQRSGTNMLMHVLDRSLETDVYHETDSRAFDNYLMRGKPIIRRLADQSRVSNVIVKALCESQDIPELIEEFHPAKAIWVVRHFDDVCNSMNVSFSSVRDVMLRIAEDPTAGAWRTAKMSSETYGLIRPIIGDDMNDATAAAIQWYIRNQLYFDLGLNDQPTVLLVFYEDLASDPVQAFERIAKFLDIELTSFMTRHVHAKSLRKRASPAISSDARDLCTRLWARFETVRECDRNTGS